MIEQLIFTTRRRRRRPDPLPHAEHGRADDLGSARTSRRSTSCRRSSPAICISRSATASPTPVPTSPRCRPGGPRRRRVGDQRPEDLDLAASTPTTSGSPPHRSRRPRHKGISMFVVPTDRGLLSRRCTLGAGHTATFYDDVRVPAEPGRRAQRRLDAHDEPAQPRAGLAPLVGTAVLAQAVGEWAKQTKLPDGPCHRPGVGAVRARPSASPGRA